MPNYPYISGPASLSKAFSQLRKNFPPRVDSAYLRRFQIAPSNESYVIAILRFLDLIDDEGNKREDKVDFFLGNIEAFESGLTAVLGDAYAALLTEMGNEAYKTSRDDLAHWFRSYDKTSDLVGKRQAATFLALGALAGQNEAAVPRPSTAAPKSRARRAAKPTSSDAVAPTAERSEAMETTPSAPRSGDVGLTVRIEVNLPAGGDSETYDAIFASIKRHLMP